MKQLPTLHLWGKNMRKISFICEDSQGKTVVEFNSIDLNNTLGKFEQFLKAVNYEIKGKLSFNVPKENYTLTNSGISYGSQSNPEITSITISPVEKTHKEGWQQYKFDSSSLQTQYNAQMPTMAPLTAASIQALTTADLKAWL